MAKQNLSSKAVISSIKCTGVQHIIWDTNETGLGLRVGGVLENDRPVLTWFVQKRLPGRKNPKKVTVGRYGHEWPPAKARKEATKIKAAMIEVTDPTV